MIVSMFFLKSRQVGTFKIVNPKHDDWESMQGSSLSLVTSLSAGSKYFKMWLKSYYPKLQTLDPAYIRLKVKIQFEALKLFCELQIFYDPAQLRTHPLWAFIPNYLHEYRYTETFSL